jgi:pyruvate formate lyase activating enzyme
MAEEKGLVTNIMRYSVKDGPGLRTTVFLKGCPLACRWCHNPECQSSTIEIVFRENRCIRCGDCIRACPQSALGLSDDGRPVLIGSCDACGRCIDACAGEAWDAFGREMTAAQVMEEVLKDRPFFEQSGGGITFSGGEPLLQPEFLLALLRACKAEELHTAVDTCGAADWVVFEKISPYVDLFLYDIKLVDDNRHRQETGVSNRRILDNLRKLTEAKRPVRVRIPIIPGINDDDENLSQTGEFITSLAVVPEVQILPYHETGMEKYRLLNRSITLQNINPPTKDVMAGIAARLRGFGITVAI